MKKFTLLLSAMLLALASNLSAETYTITFVTVQSDQTNDVGTSPTVSDIVSEGAIYVTSFTNCSKCYKGVSGVKLGTSKLNGTLEFKLADVCKSNVKKITIKSAKYGSDSGTLSLFVNGETTALKEGITPGSDDYVHTFTTAQEVSSIKLTTSAKRAYISTIIIETQEPVSTEPTLTAAPKEINLSAVYDAETGAEGETTVKISGKNLVEGGKITLSLNYDESSDCTWDFVAPESKEIEVTNATVEQDVTISYYAINAGTYTATLTITATDATSADIATVSIPVSLNVVAPYTIGWSVNGTITNTTLIPGATLKDIMPATAEVPSACSDKSFVGWCTTSTVAENGEGIVYVNENTIPEGDATYYAVFAKGSQMEGEKTIEFVPADYVEEYNLTVSTTNGLNWNKIVIDVISISADEGSTNASRFWINKGTTQWRVYSGTTITVSTSTGELTNITVNNGTTYQFQIAEDKKTATYAPSARLDVTSISATIKTMVGGYSEYATTCKGTETEIENVVAPAAIRKMIENGQLVIIIDGVKYNAQGVVIR